MICVLMWIITFYQFSILITNFVIYDSIPKDHLKVVASLRGVDIRIFLNH